MKSCNGEKCECNKNFDMHCECNFLKPLNIEILFYTSNDNEICDVLDKAKKIRNAFFTVKTSIQNFIDSCSILLEKLDTAEEINSSLMLNIKDMYLKSLNTLILSSYGALKVSYKDKSILNIGYSKLTNKEYKNTPKCSFLELKKYPDQENVCILSILQGILIQYNENSKEVIIKIRECNNVNSIENPYQSKKNMNAEIISYTLCPSILYNVNDISNNLILDDGSDDIFDNPDLTHDFLEEIVNFEDLDGINDSFGNQIDKFMDYLDNSILKIENIHKFVVQTCKINNA